MLEQHVLDLLGTDVLATTDDDVLLTTGDLQVTVRVEPGEVAGAKPAIGRERLGVQGRVEVAEEHLRSTDEQLTIRFDSDLGVAVRTSVRLGALVQSIGLVAARCARKLGRAVAAA